MEVCGSRFGIHAAVNEADQIGEMMIAKQTRDSSIAELQSPRFIETVRVGGHTAGISEKSHIQSPAQHAFICAEPLKAFFCCDGKSLIRNRPFRRPKSCGLRSKDALMIFAGTAQLLARVFWLAIGAARQGRGRV